MTRKRLVVGNWKMHTTLSEAVDLASGIARVDFSTEVVVCPPMPWLVPVKEALAGSKVSLGVQNAFPGGFGAETGSVSMEMVKTHASYVIIGHSERRISGRDTHETINAKVQSALKHGLVPIICVGEFEHLYEKERSRGRPSKIQAESNIFMQLRRALEGVPALAIPKIVVAYEPVWAIGTGEAASADYANAMITTLRKALAKHADKKKAAETRIVYGGSVNASNAVDFAAFEDIDGALVGTASLKAREFTSIIEAFSKEGSHDPSSD